MKHNLLKHAKLWNYFSNIVPKCRKDSKLYGKKWYTCQWQISTLLYWIFVTSKQDCRRWGNLCFKQTKVLWALCASKSRLTPSDTKSFTFTQGCFVLWCILWVDFEGFLRLHTWIAASRRFARSITLCSLETSEVERNVSGEKHSDVMSLYKDSPRLALPVFEKEETN